MKNCLFCKIANKEIAAEIIYENEHVVAFNDINPAANTHVLVVPKEHFTSVVDVKNAEVFAHLLEAVQHVAQITGVDVTGFRTLINSGKDSRQEIFHLHVHVLGGEPLGPIN
ncbi:MAG: histidine triad nucleotide-binding protein [Deltaproteobacteria bacterium CG_4_10_14_0_2_um_filter_43_8]|nr:MAG: histidine triad nucleotide-binding protein [Deltaproteobacteria bacterium CG11_big_fil_rev_8_21_14_0_20_42_23]PJA21108.1 MAG: histidine triad nucleotide-binding protein [Deltaproteobacteria bacterium CG_4_10_14_0_2_um_filter_43_8]PJC64941.1 MAG: histidine triad nucleotide-binding protein [Deltaproteobacteria bacterium CG_4_9_14_0_2_um_filter_42_21]